MRHRTPSRAAGCAFLLLAVLALSNCAKRFEVSGLILKVDPGSRSILVSHQAIPGYMPAMAMPFHVAPRENLDRLQPGSRVKFRLQVDRHSSNASHIRVYDARNEGVTEFRFPDVKDRLAIGATPPAVELVDQTRRAVQLSGFKGQVVAINFIYTRCPLPEVCPRLAATFLAVQRRFRERIPANLRLVSVTLDPTYDTPEVLTAYAKSIGARWSFLTGDSGKIETLARSFGLIHWAEEGVIVHTSATAVLDKNGRLAGLIEGSSYRLEELADLISTLLAQP